MPLCSRLDMRSINAISVQTIRHTLHNRTASSLYFHQCVVACVGRCSMQVLQRTLDVPRHSTGMRRQLNANDTFVCTCASAK